MAVTHASSPAAPMQQPPAVDSPAGLRAQINQLMPKHSFFRARVVVHQINSVPFVSGQFAVRWRFKNTHSHRPGLLGIVKTRSKNGDKRKDDLDSTAPPSLAVSTGFSSSDSSSNTRTPVAYSPITSNEPLTPSSPFSSNAANASNPNPALYLHLQPPKTCAESAKPAFTKVLSPPPTAGSTTSFIHQNSPPRGNTPYLDLKDHSVHWNYTLTTPIRLDIDRDTGYILPCPFKLVVMQRILSDDYPSNPQVHRLGSLNLNLAEYVGNGLVDRRYLLRESRTNATLRLTIELEYISGESHYIPPPLPKGEILNGLSNYLSGERYRSRAAHHAVHHGADLYGPYSNQQELELDLFGTCSSARQTRFPRDLEDYEIVDAESDYEEESHQTHEDEDHQELRLNSPAFDVERLPMAYGTKTTETLIEAIFNPVITTEPRCESPFTVYIPKPAPSIPAHQQQQALLMVVDKPQENSLGLGLTTTTTMMMATMTGSAPNTRPPSSLSDFTALRQPRRPSEVASLYSTESSTTGSSSAGSNAMAQSVNSHSNHHSVADDKSLKAGSLGSREGGGGEGRMRGWWKKVSMPSVSRPQTPVSRL